MKVCIPIYSMQHIIHVLEFLFIHVQFAEGVIKNEPLASITMSSADLYKLRNDLAVRLMSASGKTSMLSVIDTAYIYDNTCSCMYVQLYMYMRTWLTFQHVQLQLMYTYNSTFYIEPLDDYCRSCGFTDSADQTSDWVIIVIACIYLHEYIHHACLYIKFYALRR